MRFKFVAIIALLVMMSGVIGIISQGEDKNRDQEQEKVMVKHNVVYYITKKDFVPGDIITSNDITERKIEYFENNKPGWIENTLNTNTLEEILVGGAIATRNVSAGERLNKNDLGMMSEQLSEDYVIMPVAVLSSSLDNPEITDKGFADIYLLSNDNRVYRGNYFSATDRGDKDYKDTRVKLFAKKVFYIKNFDRANNFYNQLSGLVDKTKKMSPDSESSVSKTYSKNESMSIIYAYFKREDIEKIIQGQMLGIYVLSPGKVKNLSDGFSIIVNSSREVTPSDIVSGAPSPNDRNQILEIRGAK